MNFSKICKTYYYFKYYFKQHFKFCILLSNLSSEMSNMNNTGSFSICNILYVFKTYAGVAKSGCAVCTLHSKDSLMGSLV